VANFSRGARTLGARRPTAGLRRQRSRIRPHDPIRVRPVTSGPGEFAKDFVITFAPFSSAPPERTKLGCRPKIGGGRLT